MSVLTLIGAIAGPAVPALLGGLFTSRTAVYLALACAVAGFAGGAYVTKQFWDASEKTAIADAMARQAVGFKTVIRVERVIQARIIKVRETAQEVVREVPIIVTRQVEQACPGGLPVGFVRVHDAAAENRPAGPAAVTDADPAGIDLARAGQAIGLNYGEYHTCREQVIGWNLFYGCLRSAASEADIGRCMNQRKE